MRQPRPQLGGVTPSLGVRQHVVVPRVVRRVGSDPLLLTSEPLGLGIEGGGEIERLDSEPAVVLPVREGALHRVAEHHHQPRLGNQGRRPLGGEGMEQVIRVGLEGDRSLPLQREVSPVPALTFGVAAGEVLDLLAERGLHLRVGSQIAVQRTGATPLDADHQQPGERPQPRRRTSHGHPGDGDPAPGGEGEPLPERIAGV